jgi:hypothetical protein
VEVEGDVHASLCVFSVQGAKVVERGVQLLEEVFLLVVQKHGRHAAIVVLLVDGRLGADGLQFQDGGLAQKHPVGDGQHGAQVVAAPFEVQDVGGREVDHVHLGLVVDLGFPPVQLGHLHLGQVVVYAVHIFGLDLCEVHALGLAQPFQKGIVFQNPVVLEPISKIYVGARLTHDKRYLFLRN